MGHRVCGLVWRDDQDPGTRFPDGRLVSLGQAARAHPLGFDPGPKGELETQALLCTNLAVASVQIVEWFVLRWQLEVSYHEVRAHLGVETQRQWSDRAIARTTPILMGLFSWIALAAHSLQKHRPIIQRTAAWYAKPTPTFVDAIALVRRHLWIASHTFSTSPPEADMEKVPAALYTRLLNSLAYAA